MIAGQLALITAAAFAGAAIYISVAEHPARLALDDANALKQWKPAYERGALMQASIAIVGFLLGLLAWVQDESWLWLFGGLVLLANWPYTLLAIMPTNRALKATEPANAGPETQALMKQWGVLHAGRAGLGAVAALIFLWASLLGA